MGQGRGEQSPPETMRVSWSTVRDTLGLPRGWGEQQVPRHRASCTSHGVQAVFWGGITESLKPLFRVLLRNRSPTSLAHCLDCAPRLAKSHSPVLAPEVPRTTRTFQPSPRRGADRRAAARHAELLWQGKGKFNLPASRSAREICTNPALSWRPDSPGPWQSPCRLAQPSLATRLPR